MTKERREQKLRAELEHYQARYAFAEKLHRRAEMRRLSWTMCKITMKLLKMAGAPPRRAA